MTEGSQASRRQLQPAHWTHRLFVEEPELYLPFLEEAAGRAPAETHALQALFEDACVPPGGRVLDIACGLGRHTVLLAQRGYDVVGVDISPLYVERATEAALNAGVDARFIVGDMLHIERLMEDEAPFNAIISMFTSNGYYGRMGDMELFGQLRQLAAPGAALVVLTANLDWMARNIEGQGLDRAGQIRVVQDRQLNLDTSTLESEWSFFEGRGESLRLRLKLAMQHRVYNLPEFRGLLAEVGWTFVAGLGSEREVDLQLEELTPESKTMWVIARADD